MLRTGRLPAPHRGRSSPASTPGSRPTSGVLLPGTLASPRTGLTPAGCRELVARLRRRTPPFGGPRRPSYWTHTPLNRQPFDIAALLEQVASRWRNETPWPQVCASSTTVWLDRDKMKRIVEELLANTARAHPTGHSGLDSCRPSGH